MPGARHIVIFIGLCTGLTGRRFSLHKLTRNFHAARCPNLSRERPFKFFSGDKRPWLRVAKLRKSAHHSKAPFFSQLLSF